MNSFILLVFVCAFNVVLGAPARIQDNTLLVTYARDCKEQSGISLVALWRVALLNPADNDEGYKNYILCYLQKMGFLTPEAELRDETTDIVKWLPEEQAEQSLKEARTLCNVRKGETPGETASLTFRCFLNNGI